jgi:hypothetical protein
MKKSLTSCHHIILMSALVFIAACNTVPSSSSSSSSGGPPSSGSSGSSSSSGSSGSSSSQGSAGAGQSGQQPGSPGSQSGGKEAGDNSGTAGDENGQGMKTDDEILADALGEFDKGINKAQQEGKGEDAGATSGGAAGSTAGNGQGELTEDEKARNLDARLNSKFAKFDEVMLSERERVARGDNESGGGGNGYGEGSDDGEGTGEEDPLQTAMAGPQPPSPYGAGFPGQKRQGEDERPAPIDVGDGRDDDIIARQLREAAQKEADPELRAKLWAEYRKYKKGA